jgi:hypothetical protein
MLRDGLRVKPNLFFTPCGGVEVPDACMSTTAPSGPT